MTLELPVELIQRVQRCAFDHFGVTEADVIGLALDSLEQEVRRRAEVERAAIQEGIDAWQAGKVRPLEEFDREFRLQNNIPFDESCPNV